MHWLDWTVLIVFFAWIIYDGLKRSKDSTELEGYFLAKRSIPWWAAGISVMATQLSAITLVGTTGQGYRDGLRTDCGPRRPLRARTLWRMLRLGRPPIL